jgi:hypothetical protein
MKAKSRTQKAITWPGDLSLRFLLWREDQQWFWRFLLFLPALSAHALMITADTIDDLFDHYKD